MCNFMKIRIFCLFYNKGAHVALAEVRYLQIENYTVEYNMTNIRFLQSIGHLPVYWEHFDISLDRMFLRFWRKALGV